MMDLCFNEGHGNGRVNVSKGQDGDMRLHSYIEGMLVAALSFLIDVSIACPEGSFETL
jgi:hypothetical protein